MKPLQFHIGSIPVQVHPLFLLTAVMLGAGGSTQLVPLVVWVVVVFVGVLLHELGHALAGKTFGLDPEIDLLAFGGLTSWRGGGKGAIGTAKRVAISVAGPFTGIAIGGATWFYQRSLMESGNIPSSHVWLLLTDIWFVNFYWGAVNLLPILPLDGGNVLFAVAQKVTHGNGERPARTISLVVAGAVALYALSQGMIFNAVFAGLFALQNFQALRALGARD
jgi:membrane-associated protease RseP (regulator of RpoE activity)